MENPINNSGIVEYTPAQPEETDSNPVCLTVLTVMMAEKWIDWLPNPPVLAEFKYWMLN